MEETSFWYGQLRSGRNTPATFPGRCYEATDRYTLTGDHSNIGGIRHELSRETRTGLADDFGRSPQ